MAKKRMFRLDVLETDAFMEMPLTTQALYFHLDLRADDDGFVGNPNQIVKFIGASNDDFKLLIAKRFVLTFDDGVIVIKHWRMHNTLSKDRYHETKYIEDKAVLRLKDNKSYTFDANGKAIDDSKLIEMAQRQTKDEQKTTSDIDIDIDIDIDKDIDNNSLSSSDDDKRTAFDYKSVIDLFHRVCVSLPKVKKLTDSRKRSIRKAAKELEELDSSFESLFGCVEQSDFLTGRKGGKGFGFDWILTPKNLVKIIEGNYNNGNRSGSHYIPTEADYFEEW